MPALNHLQERKSRLSSAQNELVDIAIVGGGIHGACAAREAVLRGYRVVLFEAKDYAFGTSSRSSKLAHGGVRYLEQGNIGLVREALRERSWLLEHAPHLVRPVETIFPIVSGATRPLWQVRLGLAAYDLLSRMLVPREVRDAAREFSFSSVVDTDSDLARQVNAMGLEHSALLSYFDGQLNDARLVIENIVDAQSLGATALNWVEVKGCTQNKHKEWLIDWRDARGAIEGRTRAKVLINATGPWVPSFHKLCFPAWPAKWPTPVFSRGTHLLFNIDWKLPGLILPSKIAGKYYFSLPAYSPLSRTGRATLFGPTDIRVDANEDDPAASDQEIEELLNAARDLLPGAELTGDSLIQPFAGMRILAGPPASRHKQTSQMKVSDISRREEVLTADRYVALLGGKYTTSRHTAVALVNSSAAWLDGRPVHPLGASWTRALPGAFGFTLSARKDLCDELVRIAGGAELSEAEAQLVAREAEAAVNRFGMRAARLCGFADRLGLEQKSIDKLRIWQTALAMTEEHACTPEDVSHRRLSLDLELIEETREFDNYFKSLES